MSVLRQYRKGLKVVGSFLDVDFGSGDTQVVQGSQLPGPNAIDTTGATLNQTLIFNGTKFVPSSSSTTGAGTAYANVAVATTSNLSNLSSVSTSQDGYTIQAGDRVLVVGQTTTSENGIYVAGTPSGGLVALTRATDMAAASTLTPGSSVFVLNGTVYGATRFTSIGASGAVGTVAQTWQTFWLGSDGAISLPDARITATAGITAWDTWNAARRTLLTMSSVGIGIGDTSPTLTISDTSSRVNVNFGSSLRLTGSFGSHWFYSTGGIGIDGAADAGVGFVGFPNSGGIKINDGSAYATALSFSSGFVVFGPGGTTDSAMLTGNHCEVLASSGGHISLNFGTLQPFTFNSAQCTVGSGDNTSTPASYTFQGASASAGSGASGASITWAAGLKDGAGTAGLLAFKTSGVERLRIQAGLTLNGTFDPGIGSLAVANFASTTGGLMGLNAAGTGVYHLASVDNSNHLQFGDGATAQTLFFAGSQFFGESTDWQLANSAGNALFFRATATAQYFYYNGTETARHQQGFSVGTANDPGTGIVGVLATGGFSVNTTGTTWVNLGRWVGAASRFEFSDSSHDVLFWGASNAAFYTNSGNVIAQVNPNFQVYANGAGVCVQLSQSLGQFGTGDSTATPGAFTLRAADNVAGQTNASGAVLTVRSGLGTGNKAPAAIIFQTSAPGASGTTLQSAQEVGRWQQGLSIGTATDAGLGGLRVNTSFQLVSTDTSGTPGNATANTPSGRCKIAASASSVTITNSTVTAASHVFAQISQSAADATLTQIVSVAPGSGSFTIVGNANATAATQVDWWVINI